MRDLPVPADQQLRAAQAAGGDVAIGPDDRWHLGSNTKAMTAALWARLTEQGRAGWDMPVAEAVAKADAVVTMLPAGAHVRAVYAEQILPNAPKTALLIDCSTIDVESARAVGLQARELEFRFADAPVSGGTAAADAGTLAFMVGCDEGDFPAIEAVVQPMARAVIRAGDHGAGQAAKICNNMVLGISMLGVCEAFALAEKLGLDSERFFEIANQSSGQCWSLSTYCPWPGPVATAPSNRGYEGGFATAMMLKDLKLAQQAAAAAGAAAPMGAQAH